MSKWLHKRCWNFGTPEKGRDALQDNGNYGKNDHKDQRQVKSPARRGVGIEYDTVEFQFQHHPFHRPWGGFSNKFNTFSREDARNGTLHH